MSIDTIHTDCLSRAELRKLAREISFGDVLLSECERLEKMGIFDSFDNEINGYLDKTASFDKRKACFVNARAEAFGIIKIVAAILLEEKLSDDAEIYDTEGWKIQPARKEALDIAKRDSNFLMINILDLCPLPNNHVMEDTTSLNIFDAIGAHIGLNRGSFGFSRSGMLTPEFVATLEEQKPTWLDVAMSKDATIRKTIREKVTGNPAEPKRMVFRILELRLRRMFQEISLTITRDEIEHQIEAKLAAEKQEQKMVDDAWAGFLGKSKPKPKTSLPKSPPRAAAPSLSNANPRKRPAPKPEKAQASPGTEL